MTQRVTHLEKVGIDRRIILKWILNKECVDLFHPAQDINQNWAPMYTIVNFPFHTRYRLGQSAIQLLFIQQQSVSSTEN